MSSVYFSCTKLNIEHWRSRGTYESLAWRFVRMHWNDARFSSRVLHLPTQVPTRPSRWFSQSDVRRLPCEKRHRHLRLHSRSPHLYSLVVFFTHSLFKKKITARAWRARESICKESKANIIRCTQLRQSKWVDAAKWRGTYTRNGANQIQFTCNCKGMRMRWGEVKSMEVSVFTETGSTGNNS